MTFITPEPVVAGGPHSVTAVGGHPPAGLDDFIGDTDFVLERGVTSYLVHGCGIRLQDCVRFHEKDHLYDGKDVRVWEIRSTDGGFRAEPAAAF